MPNLLRGARQPRFAILFATLVACAESAPADSSETEFDPWWLASQQPAPAKPVDAGPSTDIYAPPQDDPFYEPPAITGQPGDLLRIRNSTFSNDPFFQIPYDDVMAWQVLYQSTDALDRPNAVSGTILVPAKAWSGSGERPLVSYAVGTRGLGDGCAPSYTLPLGVDYEGDIVRTLLDQGWAVAITDYEGSGTPGRHTYMVGPSEGHAVLDLARAAQRLDGAGLGSNTPVGLMGYSQGGGAAGWAAELAASYAPELDVKGSAVGGVPGDLAATAEFLNGSPLVAFALMAALGLDAAYPELDLDGHLNAHGRAILPKGESLCISSLDGFGSVIGDFSFTSFNDYTTSDLLMDPAWRARLREVQLGKTKPSAPVYQYHSLLDEIVPFEQAATLRTTWCTLGADVTWDVLPAEHALGIAVGPSLAIPWLAERFAGKATASNCDAP